MAESRFKATRVYEDSLVCGLAQLVVLITNWKNSLRPHRRLDSWWQAHGITHLTSTVKPQIHNVICILCWHTAKLKFFTLPSFLSLFIYSSKSPSMSWGIFMRLTQVNFRLPSLYEHILWLWGYSCPYYSVLLFFTWSFFLSHVPSCEVSFHHFPFPPMFDHYCRCRF